MSRLMLSPEIAGYLDEYRRRQMMSDADADDTGSGMAASDSDSDDAHHMAPLGFGGAGLAGAMPAPQQAASRADPPPAFSPEFLSRLRGDAPPAFSPGFVDKLKMADQGTPPSPYADPRVGALSGLFAGSQAMPNTGSFDTEIPQPSMQDSAAPQPFGPSDFVRTVRNPYGGVIEQMAYEQNGNEFGPGRIIQRPGGYDPNGNWQNAYANGVEQPRGPLTVQDMFRDALERNKADRTGSPFGYAMDPRQALAMTMGEMQPILSDRELQAKALEASLNRQNQLDIAKMNIEAGKFANRDAYDRDRHKNLTQHYLNEGYDFPTSDRMATELVNQTKKGAAPSPALPNVTADNVPQPNPLAWYRALQSSADVLPKGTQIAPYGLQSIGNKPALPIVGTAAEGSFGPANQTEFLNRIAGANLDEKGVSSLVNSLRQSPGGEAVLKSLGQRILSDQIVASTRDNPAAPPSIGGAALSKIFPGLAQMYGIGQPTYYKDVNFDYLPGVKAQAISGSPFDAIGQMTRYGMPNYRVTTPSGQTMDLDVGGSYKYRGQSDYNQQAAAQAVRKMLAQQILGVK